MQYFKKEQSGNNFSQLQALPLLNGPHLSHLC